MKIAVHASREKREGLARNEMPPLQEQIDALMEGGQKLAQMKQRIAMVRRKYRLVDDGETD